jgi:hypothetical protein
MLTLLNCLLKPRPRRAPRRTWQEVVCADLVVETAETARADPTEGSAERPRGCGWFDSSHELHCGLAVTEHLSPDSVASELPLDDWLELHLSGWRGGGQAGLAA